MDFTLPEDLRQYLEELDGFIEREIKPLEQADDNIRFFDHRREDARTDWDRGGLPSRDWEALLAGGPPAGRRGRALPLRVPEGVRRPGRSASSLGAAQFCIDRSVSLPRSGPRSAGRSRATRRSSSRWWSCRRRARCSGRSSTRRRGAWIPDGPLSQSDKVSMCNFVANRLCCDAADRAMQVHGGLGYSRHQPFEHIYRHHRRYRITEGAEEIQMRRVAGYMFGFMKQQAPKGTPSPA